MDFRKNFSERLSALRKAQHLSLSELGQHLSITDEAVRLMEKGKRSPSFEVLCKLSEYFNVSIDYLVGQTDDPTRSSTDKFNGFGDPDVRGIVAGTFAKILKDNGLWSEKTEEALSNDETLIYAVNRFVDSIELDKENNTIQINFRLDSPDKQ